jgi:hypothetical protein
MNRRSRITISALSAVAAAVVFVGPASANPTPMPMPAPALSGLSIGALNATSAELHKAADVLGPDAQSAINRLLTTALPELGVTVAQPFFYPSPTLGCGIAGAPGTVTIATAQAGPNFPIPPWIERGDLRFQALPGYIGVPTASNLSVAWINLSTLKGGIDPLDDVLLGVPTMSKTVKSGQGIVLAALFGSVTYSSGASCFALPTVGSFNA